MAVDGPVIHIDLIIIGHIHQLIPAFHKARTRGQRLQQQELGHGQRDIIALPCHRVAQGIHGQLTAFEDLAFLDIPFIILCPHFLTTQKRPDAFHQQTLGKRFGHIVIGPHTQAKNLINLVIFGCQENDRQGRGFLAQALQQIHPIHARHLDIQHSHVGHALGKGIQSGLPVIIGFHLEAFRLKGDRHRRQNITVVVNKSDPRHYRGLLVLLVNVVLFCLILAIIPFSALRINRELRIGFRTCINKTAKV